MESTGHVRASRCPGSVQEDPALLLYGLPPIGPKGRMGARGGESERQERTAVARQWRISGAVQVCAPHSRLSRCYHMRMSYHVLVWVSVFRFRARFRGFRMIYAYNHVRRILDVSLSGQILIRRYCNISDAYERASSCAHHGPRTLRTAVGARRPG